MEKQILKKKILEKKILKFFFLNKKTFESFSALNTPREPLSVQKKFSPFGPAVWQAIGNLYIYECLVLL